MDNKQSDEDREQGSKCARNLLFIRNFFRYPLKVGWFLPSSPFLVDEVLKQVDWKRAKTIVEYGPGIGTFTKALLGRMSSDAKLIAVEINPDFSSYLKRTLPDPRLVVVQRSANEVDEILTELGIEEADYVISGIPFKTLSDPLRDAIVRKTHSVLRPKGRFLVYQVSGAVLPYLERVFGNVSRDFELLNFIPARLFYCAR